MSLRLWVPPGVYAPSDDTELMAQSALAVCSGDVLEMGCGSGATLLVLPQGNARVKKMTGLDLSPAAVQASRHNARLNGLGQSTHLRILCSDLFAALPPGSRFDFVLFNPPYLPTAQGEQVRGPLNAALDGGPDGLRTVRPFLRQVPFFLKPSGKVLLLASSLQPLEELRSLARQAGFSRIEKMAERAFFFERLEVWKLGK